MFDSADRLASLNARMITNLMQLGRLTGCNICPVFTCLSDKALLPAVSDWMVTFSTSVLCPPPSHDTVCTLVAEQLGSHPQARPFVSQLWSLFSGLCGPNLRELSYLARVLFPIFTEGGATSAAFKAAVSSARESLFTHDLDLDEAGAPSTRGVELELPYYTKYLLLAAYCASHNPPESDTRYFTKVTGKGGSRRRSKAPKRSRTAELGHSEPKAFQLERLLAIFSSLITANDGGCPPSEIASAEMLSEVCVPSVRLLLVLVLCFVS